MANAIRMLVGSAELPPASDNKNQQNSSSPPKKTKSFYDKLPMSLRFILREFLHIIHQGPKHKLCRHKHSCQGYVIEGSLRLFGIGYAIQAAISLIGALRVVFRKPGALLDAAFNKNNFYLGAFLGSFVGVFKAVNCGLRWLRDEDTALHGLIAGFLAGASMMFYKSSTITLYLASKLAEILYFKGIAAGYLPYIKWADIIIYSISTAFVFHAAVFEPHNLRPAYWRWLLRITNNKFALMNRKIIEFYGTKASLLYPDFYPKYDSRYSSLKYDQLDKFIRG